MHQHPRPAPRMASPANSPQTNPTRTNNQRDQPAERTTSSSDLLTYQGRDSGDGYGVRQDDRLTAEQKEHQKLNQVIQQFFYKASLTIISARTNLPQSFKHESRTARSNKWFNILLDETDVLTDDLWEWKSTNVAERLPDPLIIEIYLDTTEVTSNHALVAIDEEGKRWNVAQALSSLSNPLGRSRSKQSHHTQVILERWRIELGDPRAMGRAELRDALPNVYKKAVVLFKSLYTYTRMLPAWKFWRNVSKQPAGQATLKPKYRISNGDFQGSEIDALNIALYNSPEPVTDQYFFAPTNSPAGPFLIQVNYRTRCDFRVDDSEALLSSHFMGIDDYFTPSLGGGVRGVAGMHEPGSLPVDSRESRNRPELGLAYGSMSTFHRIGPVSGSSPISALRAAGELASSSPKESPPQKLPPNHRTTQGSKSSLRSAEGGMPLPRRTSVSFQPFKAGSLSSSPAPGPQVPPSPGSSFGRNTNPSALAQARNRASLTTLPQPALRAPSIPNETAIASSAPSSPKPAPISRYSSSFSHRRTRFSSGGGSKTEDDNSSGKASLNSSNQPGSGLLAEGEGTSTGSAQTDEDTISDFLKLLEKGKELKSFNRSDAESREASTKRITAQLSKYQRMPDSNAQLSDSISSSHLLHRSSSSSSRHVSNVPALGAGASVSTSSSPGKPISPHTPHTPHTPAVPSRLSANSVIEYAERRSSRSRLGPPTTEETEPEEDSGTITSPRAIDIPTSPRQQPHPRRTSSYRQRQRILQGDVGVHSASVPIDDRPDLSPSELLNFHEPANVIPANASAGDGQPNSGITTEETVSPLTRHHLSGSSDARDTAFGQRQTGTVNTQLPLRPRLASIRGRRGSAAGSTSSFERGTGASGSGESSRAGRYSFSARGGAVSGGASMGMTMPGGFEDDEPLLFAIDDSQGGGGRRSVEEGRGGGVVGMSGGVRRGGSPRRG